MRPRTGGNHHLVNDLARVLLVVGGVLVAGGLVLLAGSKLGLGRLPGDLRFGSGNTRVYVPLATSVILSIVATVLLNLFLRR